MHQGNKVFAVSTIFGGRNFGKFHPFLEFGLKKTKITEDDWSLSASQLLMDPFFLSVTRGQICWIAGVKKWQRKCTFVSMKVSSERKVDSWNRKESLDFLKDQNSKQSGAQSGEAHDRELFLRNVQALRPWPASASSRLLFV